MCGKRQKPDVEDVVSYGIMVFAYITKKEKKVCPKM